MLYLFAALFAASGCFFLYNRFWPKPAPSATYQTAQPASGMADPPTESVKVTVPIKAYDKQKAAKKMSLPVEVTEDPKSALLQTARVKPSEGGYTAAAVLDTTTGGTKLLVKEEPRPLFAVGGKTGIGAIAGVTTKGNAAGIYANQDILRVGPVSVGVAGGAGTLGNDFVAGGFIHIHGQF